MLALLLAALLVPHARSMSSTTVDVSDSLVVAALRCQSLSVIDSLGGDEDGDGRLDEAEFAALLPAIEEHLFANWIPTAEGVEFELRLARTAIEPQENLRDYQWLQLELQIETTERLDELTIENRLFLDGNPQHVDFTELTWEGGPVYNFIFRDDERVLRFPPEGEQRHFGAYVRLGAEHILTGWDHLAFLVAVLFATVGWRALLWIVTGFTVAHSVTLAAASLGWVSVPSRPVELAIALSIVYVAGVNLIDRRPRTPRLEVFLFGLVHGLGFAGFLADALSVETQRLQALVGFNLGVELGQLAVVLPVAFLLTRLPGRRAADDSQREALAPRWLVLAGSAVTVVLALYWFVERI